MRSFWQDLRYAARTLRNSLGFTTIAVVTLGLGMAVNTTVFSVINGLILRPLPVPQPEQIVVLAMKQEGTSGLQKFSHPDYQDIASQTDAFRDVFGYRPTLGVLAADGKGNRCLLSRVTGNYFSALQIKPALGRLILPSEGQAPGADSVIVLGYSYWQKRFGGDHGVIGKQVEINRHTVTIVGVAPKEFHGTFAIVDMDGYVPLSSAGGSALEDGDKAVGQFWTNRQDRSITVLGRLQPGVSMKEAQARLSVVAQRIAAAHPDVYRGVSFLAFPEKLARPDPDPENVLPAVAIAFTVLAALVLLVACFNIANVLLVRATVRQREMGIRAALGAGRGRLVRQHLTESLLLALLGGGAGLLLGSWAVGFLSALPLGTDLPITFDFQPDTRVYFSALGAVIATGLIVGIVPALRVARSDVNAVLREGGRGASDGPRASRKECSGCCAVGGLHGAADRSRPFCSQPRQSTANLFGFRSGKCFELFHRRAAGGLQRNARARMLSPNRGASRHVAGSCVYRSGLFRSLGRSQYGRSCQRRRSASRARQTVSEGAVQYSYS
jgi:predicted permease